MPSPPPPTADPDDLFATTRRIAAALLQDERNWHTLQPTDIVNEAWVRLASHLTQDRLSEPEQIHIRALFAKVMRQVLVDHARARGTLKRGGGSGGSGGFEHAVMHDGLQVHALSPGARVRAAPDELCERNEDILILDTLLKELAVRDARAASVVELRYFAGLTVQQTALALGVSDFTVEEDWRIAKAWLAVQVRKRRGGTT